jgi:hypothetical protein
MGDRRYDIPIQLVLLGHLGQTLQDLFSDSLVCHQAVQSSNISGRDGLA